MKAWKIVIPILFMLSVAAAYIFIVDDDSAPQQKQSQSHKSNMSNIEFGK